MIMDKYALERCDAWICGLRTGDLCKTYDKSDIMPRFSIAGFTKVSVKRERGLYTA